MDDTTSPIEAGLGWITKFAEGKNFTNRAELERQKKEGVTRKLCAFELQEKEFPVMAMRSPMRKECNWRGYFRYDVSGIEEGDRYGIRET